ncbi:MAG: hypothetical protein LBJ11_05340 [Oscillospiraceae bacterium]|jgi:hypothetical protein|nr:hypothetical protein [Oscillospiraceae bacterium]
MAILLRDLTGRPAELERWFPEMFGIIAANMRRIAPTGNPLEEDRRAWTEAMHGEMQDPAKHWVLAVSGDVPDAGDAAVSQAVLAGYVLYRIGGGICHMDEIQIAAPFQGDGAVFPLLLGRLLGDVRRAGVTQLQSSANKQKRKVPGDPAPVGPAGDGGNAAQFPFPGHGSGRAGLVRREVSAGERQNKIKISQLNGGMFDAKQRGVRVSAIRRARRHAADQHPGFVSGYAAKHHSVPVGC